MAIDFLIFGLLIISFTTNLLALGAFWVTPGLRTTANRFTINLLIINLVGCLILAPTLFLSSNSSGDAALLNSSVSSLETIIEASENRDDSVEYILKPGNHQLTFRHNGHLVEKEGIILQQRNASDSSESTSTEPRTIKTIFKCNSTFYQQLTIDEGSRTLVITEIEEQQQQPSTNISQNTPLFARPPIVLRCWSIDMASALGALAVLLVVGDTWCAVTDPLRYHSRISGLKAWVLISLTWVLGIFFGALSAFRELNFESETVLSMQKHFATDATADAAQLKHSSESAVLMWTSTSSIFSMVYACIYFVVIILLPFGFVCGMYWRIFSEARENGLRMRQNGSSPLLQSATNLTAQQQLHQRPSSYTSILCNHRNSLSSASSLGGGLQMCIDHQQKGSATCLRRDSAAKVLLPTISDDCGSDEIDVDSTHGQLISVAEQPNRTQNIMLTLQTASGEIKRNYSTRQLPLLGTSQELSEKQRLHGIRQVHSTPNLQKYAQLRRDSLSDGNIDPHLLGAAYALRPYSHPPLRNHLYHQHNQQMRDNHVHSPHMVRVIPSINASPKAFSYMSSLRHRLSNASSLFKYREESRAARISILVVIMFLVSYLPYGFLVLLQSQLSAANFVHSTQIAIFMLLLGNLSSPFIFAYRNKRVRRGVKRLFGLNADAHDRQRQRDRNSSARSSSCLHRYSGNKSCTGIKRTGSKASTYSAHSCKLLTPQSSLVSNNNNSNCSNNNKSSSASELSHPNNNKAYIIASILDEKSAAGVTCSVRPVLQRGITIVEQMPLPNNKLKEKRTMFQKLRQFSKRLRYAPQSCAQADPAAV